MKWLKNIPEWLKFTFKLTLTTAALAFVIFKVDFTLVLKIITESNWWYLIPAFAFFVFSKIIASIRLNQYFRNIKIRLSYLKNMKLYWLGMFYNLFLPGGIGGDGYKIFILNKKYEVGAKKIFQSVLLDRISGLAALVSLALILTVFLPLQNWLILVFYLLLPLMLFLFYFFIKWFFKIFVSSFTITTFLSFLVQLSQVISVLFIMKALKIDASEEIYLFVFLLSSIVATIPFTVGGVGARELTFLYAATWFNIETEPAISLSFLFFIITALTSLYGVRYSVVRNFEKQFS